MRMDNSGRRFMALSLLTMFVLVGALLASCGKGPTAPIGHARQSDSRFASVVAMERLEASGVASKDSLDAAVTFQRACQDRIVEHDPAVVGTAASTVDGHPVVLALTRKPVGTLPGAVDGHRVVEFVVGDVMAQSYYAGTSFGPASQCLEGTAGAIVTDGVRNYWLSNWHVFVRQTGAVGSAVVSPSRGMVACGTSTTVANVSRFVSVRFDGSVNTVDCAIARVATGTSVSPIQAAGTNSYLSVATPVQPVTGLPVKKVGAATGYTTGKVAAINASIDVKYASIGTARFGGVVMFSPMCSPGDSGSLICTQAGNNPVALLFAANSNATFGCPISAVFSAIGAHVAN